VTSDQIKARQAIELSERDWLQEVAYQLALLNEKQAKPAPEPVKVPFKPAGKR
jgi:hypothetical protein